MACRARLIFLIIFILSFQTSAAAQRLASAEEGPGASDAKSRAGRRGQASTDGAQRGGWVVAAYAGGARTADTPLSVSQPALGTALTFRDVSLRSRSFDPPLYYGFRGGYFLRRLPAVGFEAEFIHLKVFSDPRQRVRVAGLRRGVPVEGELPLGQIVEQYSVSHGVNLLLFNVAARRGLWRGEDAPDGRLILAARFGAGPTLPHTESSVEGLRQEQYEVGRPAWQAAGGAELKVWRGLYALGEYKFTRTRQRGRIHSGTAESLLRTHHGVFGLSYHF
ncbi:MAG TPA: hypothetical protein VG148_06385 [Pyrinomonadaceae bacterium]|nr:hypothetical protein [Pyrinomonadaceae bacterium]